MNPDTPPPSADAPEIDAQTLDTPKLEAPKLDRRRNIYRADLAAQSLRGQVDAARFAAPEPRQVQRASIAMRGEPNPAAMLDNEALFGEWVDVYDDHDGWAWVQLARDRYTGYVASDALAPEPLVPTHRVSAAGTFVYTNADIKSPPLLLLSMNAALTLTSIGDRFGQLAHGGFIIMRHVAPIAKPALDFVEIAERFTGTPYLWGGRTRMGLDCSALVQIAMEAAGLECPRDSDMQKAEVGAAVDPAIDADANFDRLQRGDLVFWKGHVGIMLDAVMLLHANAHHMAVAAEPLAYAAERIAKAGGGPVTAIKRNPTRAHQSTGSENHAVS